MQKAGSGKKPERRIKVRTFLERAAAGVLAVLLILAAAGTTGRAAEVPSGTHVLVAYYSASGNTKRAAEGIAAVTWADLFAITPADPYTEADLNWTDPESRVNREHENSALQDIPLAQTAPENFDQYDVVFLGFPVWWKAPSWVTHRFVTGNEFTGKVVIPFATSMATPMGDMGLSLRQMAGTGAFAEDVRFPGSVTREEAADWVLRYTGAIE